MQQLVLILSLILISIFSGHAKENTSQAIDFKGTTINGEEVKLSDFKGKVVLLDFWASWCKPCQKEFPFLIDLYNTRKGRDLTVLAINLDKYADNMKGFLAKIGEKTPFPIIRDKDGKLPQLYKVEGMPTTIFIDKKGAIRYRHTGFTTDDKPKYVKELKTLLGEDYEQN